MIARFMFFYKPGVTPSPSRFPAASTRRRTTPPPPLYSRRCRGPGMPKLHARKMPPARPSLASTLLRYRLALPRRSPSTTEPTPSCDPPPTIHRRFSFAVLAPEQPRRHHRSPANPSSAGGSRQERRDEGGREETPTGGPSLSAKEGTKKGKEGEERRRSSPLKPSRPFCSLAILFT
jgi:hypothetical protein